MTRISLKRSTALAAVLALPSTAHAQDFTFWDLFSVDRIGTTVVQSAIATARGFAEIQFADIDIRPLDGYLALTGLEIRPYDLERYPDCAITIDQIVMTSHPILQTDYSSVRFRISGATAPVACLDPWDREEALALGFDVLTINQAVIEAEYEMASGALDVDFHIQSEGNGTLTGDLDFAYASLNLDYEEPVLDLDRAALSFANDGLWERFAGELPPFITNAQMLQSIMEEQLLPVPAVQPAPVPTPEPVAPPPAGGGGGKPGDTPPGSDPAPTPPPAAEPQPAPEPIADPAVEEARDFIASAALIASGFAQDPNRIAARVDPIGPIRLTEDMFEDFVTFVAVMEPHLELGDPEATVASPEMSEAIAAILAGDAPELGDVARHDLARALIEGQGIPQSPELAIEVLGPLFDAGDPTAVQLLGDHFDMIAADRVYAALLLAAEQNTRSAYLSLNAAEQRLGLVGVLAAQGGAVSAYAPGDDQSALAQAALLGDGTPRNYAQAYYHALLGEAGGQTGAGALVEELADMGRLFDAPEAWDAMLSETRGLAMSDWLAAHTPEPEPEASEEDTDAEPTEETDQ